MACKEYIWKTPNTVQEAADAVDELRSSLLFNEDITDKLPDGDSTAEWLMVMSYMQLAWGQLTLLAARPKTQHS
jgi:hypothetical protein